MSHYNGKKQLLQKSEEEMANLRHSLEIQDHKVKTVAMENKQLQLDLEKAQTNEKNLLKTVASLEAQVGVVFKHTQRS